MGSTRNTFTAVLMCVVLLVAGCSSAEDANDGLVESAGSGSTTATSPAEPDTSTSSTEVGSDVPATDAPSSGGTRPPATKGQTDPSPAPSPAPPATSPPPTADTSRPAPAVGGVGAYAPFYLRPSESSRIVLEIRSQAGAEPNQATVDHLRRVLGEVSAKPVVRSGGDIPGGARQWTAEAIRDLADASGVGQRRDGAVMRILFLRGGFADSDTALGVSVRSDVAAVFADKVDEGAGLVGDRARIEDAVTVHEAGHLLGLVDLFLSTGRQDPEHPGHSPNRESVMYFAVESTLVGSVLDGGPPTEFDAADRQDLATIRAGGGPS